VWNNSRVAYCWSSSIHRDTCRSLQRESVTKCSNTHAFWRLSLRVLFNSTINDEGSNWEWSCHIHVLVCVKYAIWLVLSSTGTYHFLTAVCRQRTFRKPCCGREPRVRCRCKIRHVEIYSGTALFYPAITRLSCFYAASTSLPGLFYNEFLLLFALATTESKILKMLSVNRNTAVAYSFVNIVCKCWFNVKRSQLDYLFFQPDLHWFQFVYSAWTRYAPVYSA